MNLNRINRASGGVRAWNVRRPFGRMMDVPHLCHRIRNDTVFFDGDMDADTVRRCLIDHDGYPSDILVSEDR